MNIAKGIGYLCVRDILVMLKDIGRTKGEVGYGHMDIGDKLPALNKILITKSLDPESILNILGNIFEKNNRIITLCF